MRETTLPSLLNEYRSDSENKIESQKEQQHHQKESKKRKSKKQPPRQSRSPIHRTPTPGDPVRSARHQRAEAERLVRVADTWDQAIAEVLQERHDQLNKKLVLQHALIKAQDRRSDLIRQEEEEARVKKRNEEKKLKQEKLASLQSQFKQSLDSDRKQKRKPKTNDVDIASSDRQSVEGDGEKMSDTSSHVAGSEDSGSQRRGSKRAGHSGYLPSDAYVPVTSPMKELEESEEEEEGTTNKERAPDGVVTPADLSAVPWHHAQLYKMYGRNADYYIHPKMQPEKKKIVNPTLKSQKVRKMGHLGASHIWTTLRGDSVSKLLRTDQRFPQELKEAFSSHVRDGITKHKKPVFRNFTETEDVPDLKKLMDQSLLRRIRVLRHKTELMYRSSQTNHDRTKILLFNSPLPSVSEGDEGIDRYLPSWDDAASESTDASYMKWIKSKHAKDSYEKEDDDEREEEEDGENIPPAVEGRKRQHPISVLSPVGSDVSENLQSIWHSIMARQRPRRQPKYHFLTEEEARTQGAFLAKLGLEKDKLDRGRTDLLPQLEGYGRRSLPSIKSQSAQEIRSMRHSEAGFPRRSDTAHNSHSSQSSRYESRWQPLSMHALIEYKEQLATEGNGEFKQGRPAMWNTLTSQE